MRHALVFRVYVFPAKTVRFESAVVEVGRSTASRLDLCLGHLGYSAKEVNSSSVAWAFGYTG